MKLRLSSFKHCFYLENDSFEQFNNNTNNNTNNNNNYNVRGHICCT